MKKISLIITLILMSITFTSCKVKDADLVATFYPHYDILNNIVKDKMTVKLVVPFGAEVHDFSPTPKDIVMINNAKLFVYASDELDIWVNELVNTDINIINMYNHLNIESTDLSVTIHYWADPFIFIDMINVLLDEIIKIDSKNESFYTNNANNYINEILLIHNEFLTYLETATKKPIFFAGHNALGGFSKLYDLEIITLIEHFNPEAEFTIKQILNIIEGLKDEGSHYLFIEELIEPKVANTIKKELAKEDYEIILLELHGYHNITKKQSKEGITYANLFMQNVRNIKQAFN